MWFTTGDSLNRFDRETETFVLYLYDPDDHRSLSNEPLTDILNDHSGAMWIGALGGGLNRCNPKGDNITTYQHDSHKASRLSRDNLLALFLDQSGIIWIGAAGGRYYTDSTGNGRRCLGECL